MAKDLFSRYVWLVDIIYRAGRINFKDISDKWETRTGERMPLRTFNNHRISIEEMFDINILCDRHNGYVYYIENPEDVKQENIRSWLLSAFAVNNLINESQKLRHRILTENIPSGQRFLSAIIEAMRDNLSLRITYQSFWDKEARLITVEPYCVKIFRQRWYVLAYLPNTDELKIYALDRISDIFSTDEIFEIPAEFDAEEYFRNCFGIINDPDCDPEAIVLKIHGKHVDYVRTLPLHHSQKEIETAEDYSLFKYYLSPAYDFFQELLSQGANVEVHSPEWLRRDVANAIRLASERYRDYLNLGKIL